MFWAPGKGKRRKIGPGSVLLVHGAKDVAGLIDGAVELVGPGAFKTRPTTSDTFLIEAPLEEVRSKLADYFVEGLSGPVQPEEPGFRATIKGLHRDLAPNWVSNKLEGMGFRPKTVVRAVGAVSGEPLNVFRVELEPRKGNQDLVKITEIGTFPVKVEPQGRARGIIQCFRCQKFGHKQIECTQPEFTCFKCAGTHKYIDCPKPRSVEGKCANCGGNHIAAFMGCSSYKEAIRNLSHVAIPVRKKRALRTLGLATGPRLDRPMPDDGTQGPDEAVTAAPGAGALPATGLREEDWLMAVTQEDFDL
ncbi:uncharacterized protein LOC117782608 [Drosophila innubila]|uniref:uncharacterized protein LOC117782608 n=1 Tax=Drosophila innubila TaxID=198719 RepID=UPI00148C6521|nr:uncharacterized protein LOC117782608 [Drosophila innubila]